MERRAFTIRTPRFREQMDRRGNITPNTGIEIAVEWARNPSLSSPSCLDQGRTARIPVGLLSTKEKDKNSPHFPMTGKNAQVSAVPSLESPRFRLCCWKYGGRTLRLELSLSLLHLLLLFFTSPTHMGKKPTQTCFTA